MLIFMINQFYKDFKVRDYLDDNILKNQSSSNLLVSPRIISVLSASSYQAEQTLSVAISPRLGTIVKMTYFYVKSKKPVDCSKKQLAAFFGVRISI